MIKTLRITSVLAAVLAITFFVALVVYGVHNDENIEKYLNSPDVIEQFKKAKGNSAKTDESQISPLVQRAQDFASILNPPKPKETIHSRTGHSATNINRELNVKPKFTVKGTSYYEANPELSMVLIDEPGKGSHWVRQSTMVGHLLIEDVKDGLVVVKSSEGTYELKIEEKPVKSSTTSSSSVQTRTPTRPTTNQRRTTIPSQRTVVKPQSRQRIPNTVDRPPIETINIDRSAELEDLVEKLKELRTDQDSDRIDSGPSNEEKAAMIEKLISNFRNSNTNINEKEAEKLDILGGLLDDMRTNSK